MDAIYKRRNYVSSVYATTCKLIVLQITLSCKGIYTVVKDFIPCCTDLHECACAQYLIKLEEAKDPSSWKYSFGSEYYSTEYMEEAFTLAYNACLVRRFGVKLGNTDEP